MSEIADPESHRISKLAQASGAVKNAPARFAADCMLGRLARWLRILGHDVAYFPRIHDAELVALAAREGRTLITRDTRLVLRRAARGAILIRSHALEEQLREMAPWLGGALPSAVPLGRCTVCNHPVQPLEKALAQSRVPPYVFQTQASFVECLACGRIYWNATHVRDIQERLARMAPGGPAPSEP